MKYYLLICGCFMYFFVSGQIPIPDNSSIDRGFKTIDEIKDMKLVPIAVVIPEQTDMNFESVNNLLENKLSFIVNQNGLTDKMQSPRFMIFPQIAIEEKEYTTTAPVKTVLVLNVNLYIADYLDC